LEAEVQLADTLIRPIITEKSSTLLGDEATFAFEVGLAANKFQIKQAIEQFYGVDVVDVRTLVVRGKIKRFGRHMGKRSNWKKAYITLAEGQSLPIFGEG
jgi:large subunit ribosomal protein L23